MSIEGTVFTSVQNERFHEEVSRQIARHIVRGDLPNGSPLPSEATLIQQFEVSRAVVREALRSLVQRGLVDMRQGRRTVVLPQEEWDVLDPLVLEAYREEGLIEPLIRDFLWIRCMLEPSVAAEAARHANASLVDDLRSCLQRMEDNLDNATVFFSEDMAFHNFLAAATGNRVLLRIMTTISHLFNVTRDLTHEVATAPLGALEWHKQIYNAIAKKDPDGAREAMADHLKWTTERILLNEAAKNRGGATELALKKSAKTLGICRA